MRLLLFSLLGACGAAPDTSTFRHAQPGDVLSVAWSGDIACGSVVAMPCPSQVFSTQLEIATTVVSWSHPPPGVTPYFPPVQDRFNVDDDGNLVYDGKVGEAGTRLPGRLYITSRGYSSDVEYQLDSRSDNVTFHVEATW